MLGSGPSPAQAMTGVGRPAHADDGQLTQGAILDQEADAGLTSTALGNSPGLAQLSSYRCSPEKVPESRPREPLSRVRGTLRLPPHPLSLHPPLLHPPFPF